MNFQFDSLREFILMGDHGPYVWACYAITFALMLYLAWAPGIRTRQFIRQQKRIEQRLSSARQREASTLSGN
ncbi:heme exporter protein CcmD [Gilvimarinus sp. F26214L]|uniref:heme exporter protein CcmD n=1 Tax=Gilvimarinus sp. DZF01 TaxID=3461371 RepID=UPI004045748A